MSTGAFAGAEEFDPNAYFMPKYATRRTDLEKHIARHQQPAYRIN